MNKIPLLILTLLISLFSFAQSGIVQGTVSNFPTSSYPSGILVHIYYYESNTLAPGTFLKSDSVRTNSTGFYSLPFSLSTSTTWGSGTIIAQIENCINRNVIDSAVWTHTTSNLSTINLDYCDTVGAAACMASFSLIPGGYLTRSFNNTTNPLASGVRYTWDFGDGNFSNATHPTHTWNAPGTYYVCLSIADSNSSCTDNFCDVITVTSPITPGCTASYGPPSGSNLSRTFSNTSSPMSPALTYDWDFGDGLFSTAKNPSHTWASAGTYNVCLTITDTVTNCTDTFCDSITVTSPIAITSGVVSGNVSNLPSAIYPPGLLVRAYYYDGYTPTSVNLLYSDTSRTDTSGNYSIPFSFSSSSFGGRVIVEIVDCNSNLYIDTTNWKHSTSNIRTVNLDYCKPTSPTCTALFGYTGGYYKTLSFVNASSPITSSTLFSWDFGDTTTSNAINPTHVYSSVGTYNVCLTLTDTATNCADTSCASIPVLNIPNPNVSGIISGKVYNMPTSSYPPGILVNLKFYTGNSLAPSTLVHSDTIRTDSTGNYSLPFGFYTLPMWGTIVAEITDCQNKNYIDSSIWNRGGGNYKTINLDYCDSIPLCSASFTVSGGSPTPRRVLTNTSEPNLSRINYLWDFGDSTNSSLKSVNKLWSNYGTYNVCLTVIDSVSSCTDTFCDSVTMTIPIRSGVINGTVANLPKSVYPPGLKVKFYFYYGFGPTSPINLEHVDSTNTDSIGNYSLLYNFGSINSNGKVFAEIVDCGNKIKTNSSVWGTSPTPRTINLDYCDTAVACTASFSPPSGSYLTKTFSNTSIPMSSNVIYNWDFGDGTFSGSTNPTHSYVSAGTYNVCLTVTDTSINCTDTYCDSITAVNFSFNISGTVEGDVYNLPTSAYPPGLLVTVYFYDKNSLNPSTLVYSDTTRTDSNGSYLLPFSFYSNNIWGTIVSEITDCRNKSYIDSSLWGWSGPSYVNNRTINLDYCNTTRPLCSASFNYYHGPGLSKAFSNTSSPLFSNVIHSWDFGDGTSSNLMSPTHTWITAGIYNVCLTITDTVLNCSDTYCDSVNLINPPALYWISGIVKKGSNILMNGKMTTYLIQADSNNYLSLVDSVTTYNPGGKFEFYVESGIYYVKTALEPINPDFANYLPTYYGDELYWASATPITVNNSVNLNGITMTPGTNPGGPGFIGGLVSLGANKAAGPGDPVVGANVILTDELGNGVAFRATDANGEYEFPSLAYGTYKLFVDILNKTAKPRTITLGLGNDKITNVNFEVGESEITGIRENDNVNVIGLYPNPAKESVKLSLNVKTADVVQLVVTDVLGKEFVNSQLNLGTGTQTVTINLSDLPEGIYLFNIISENEVIGRKLIKY